MCESSADFATLAGCQILTCSYNIALQKTYIIQLSFRGGSSQELVVLGWDALLTSFVMLGKPYWSFSPSFVQSPKRELGEISLKSSSSFPTWEWECEVLKEKMWSMVLTWKVTEVVWAGRELHAFSIYKSPVYVTAITHKCQLGVYQCLAFLLILYVCRV